MATPTKTKRPNSRAKSSGKRAKTKPGTSPPKTGAPSTKVQKKKPESKTRQRRRVVKRDSVKDGPIYVMTTKQIENFLYRLAVDDTYWQALLNDPRGTCLAVGVELPEDFVLPINLPSRTQILELLSTLAERLHDFACAQWDFHLLFDADSGILDPP
jgi:hypothetical protein